MSDGAVSSFVNELALHSASDGDAILGRGEVLPEMCVPGTDVLRTSILATWADVVAGWIAGRAIDPRIPLTLDLEVQLEGQARAGTIVAAEASAVKVGRTVVVLETRFRDAESGAPVGLALVSFIASPDPAHVFPEGFPPPTNMEGRLTTPFAERVGCSVVEPGTVEVPHRRDGLNASGAIQGGIVALAAEEAASSLVPEPVVLHAFNVRYLRPFTVGPARAVADGTIDFAVVRLTDIGTGRLGAIATARATRLAQI